MELTHLALRRPVFILMVVLWLSFTGYLAFKSTRMELNPEVSFGVLTVVTSYPGAGAEEIAEQVSKKIEDSVSGIEGLKEIFSLSQEGVSIVSINFEIGTDMDSALNDTRSKLDTIIPKLPSNINTPTISKLDTGSEPIITLALKSNAWSDGELRDIADEKLKDVISRIPGVAGVYVSGGEEKEIQLKLYSEKLLEYGISAFDVLNTLKTSHLNMPVGFIESGKDEQSLRIQGEASTIDGLKNLYVSKKSQTKNGPVTIAYKLGDIAEIVYGYKEKREIATLNGSSAVLMTVLKAREGNAIEISKAIQNMKAEVEERYRIDLVKTLDTSIQVEESIADLNFALFFGIFLVVCIIYLFLHNFRGMFIVAITIPITLLSSFLAIKAFGFTINNMSMLALSLAIGVLVDDAIVVLENIYRHLKMGEDPYTAAIKGRSEIGLAAIAITLADVVVFLPVGTMDGIVGQFFRPLGIVFTVVVLLSLLVSFTVTPLLASMWYKAGEDLENPTNKFSAWFERKFLSLEAWYRAVLVKALANHYKVFVGGFTSLVCVVMFMIGGFAESVLSAFWIGLKPCLVMLIFGVLIDLIYRKIYKTNIGASLPSLSFGFCFIVSALLGYGYGLWKGEDVFKFSFFPPNDSGKVSIYLELPEGSSLNETEKAARDIEEIVAMHKDVKNVLGSIGTSGQNRFGLSQNATNMAKIDALLKPKIALFDRLGFGHVDKKELRYTSDISVAADITALLGKRAGVDIRVSAADMFGVGSPIQLSFQSNDREKLRSTTEKIYKILNEGRIPGLINLSSSYKKGKGEIVAVPRRKDMADLGVTSAQLAQGMRLLYSGNDDVKFRMEGKEIPVRVKLNAEEKNDLAFIHRIPLLFMNNKPVYFNELVDIQTRKGVEKISRRDLSEEIQIKASLLPGYAAGSVQKEIDTLLFKENLIQENMIYKPLGQADLQNKESGYLMGALGMGFLLVYLLLASLYNNMLYPFIIQLSQPQALVGALLALMLSDKTLNLVGFIGIIALVGLVGKNAILLVDYTNTLRERGYSRYDAIIESGPTRLRPILMTTLAVILGMLPVALAIGRGSEFRETIGIVIIGGISLSTVLTLVVIPCSYLIFDDLSEKFHHYKKTFSSRL